MDPDQPKKKYWKFVAGFLAMIFVAIAAIFVWQFYELKDAARAKAAAAQKVLEEMKRAELEFYQKQVSDTYGGKTPQDTLRLYIDAVEKGDYVLASKYFVIEKQGVELNRLKGINTDYFSKYIKVMEKAEPWRSSLEEKTFTMSAKTDAGPSIFIRFVKYPSGIWKIVEI